MSARVRSRNRFVLLVLILFPVLGAVAQEGTRLVLSAAFERVPGIAARYCSACHDWARSPEGVMGLVEPGDPEASPFFAMMDAGFMPPDEPRPSEAERRIVEDWIRAGANESAFIAPVDADSSASAALPASAAGASPEQVRLHKALGFASSALLLAAGAVGTWRFFDLMDRGHAYRDSIAFDEEDPDEALRSAEIQALWEDGGGQALRWTHVGLLAAGGSLYLYNAFSGIGMFSPEDPGLSKRDLHRYGFFLHLGLMSAEAVLGFVMSDALKKGDHDLVEDLGPWHVALGAATPLVIAASGFVITLRY